MLSAPAFLAWETFGAVRRSRARARDASTLAASVTPVEPRAPAGIDLIDSRAPFQDAARFQDRLFVASPGAVVEYDANGAAVRRFRSGFELPPVRIAAVTTAVLAARSAVELLIATNDGVIAYDGRGFRHVRPVRDEYRNVSAMLPIASWRVLLATGRGVLAFDGDTLAVAHSELAAVDATALAGAEGDIWIGTTDRGVWHWRGGAVERFDDTAGLPDRRVLAIATEGSRAYVATPVGVAEFDGGRFTRTLADGLFASAIAVRDGALLVGTIDETLATIPLASRGSHGIRPLLEDVPSAIRRFIVADGTLLALADDGVYVAADGAGGRRCVIRADGRLTDRNISALAVDRAGRLWVGYFDRGLDILNASGEPQAHVETDRVFCVNRIVHDPATGMTAVGTANGLAWFDRAGALKQVVGRAQGLIADHVTDMLVDGDRVTVATPAGLTFIDRDGSRSLYAFHGLVNNHVYALAESGGELLAGTLGGASVLDGGLVRASYTSANSALTHNWITAIARVDDGWIVGTYGGGLFRMDARGEWSRFGGVAAGVEINPNAMTVTDEHVFAGTLTKGLLVYDRQSARWSAVTDGLPSLNVTALAAANGTIYVGTDNGVVRASEQRLAAR